jgi:DNA-binding GntR family transcriptional regulator
MSVQLKRQPLSNRKAGGGELLADEVRAKLRSMILAAELKPGQRLVEDDLCDWLKVGRTPVREALLLLQGEGYLVRERGWVVLSVDRLKVHAIFESRAAIEGAAARLAARRVTPAICKKLMAMVETMEPPITMTRLELNRINTKFHTLILETADNSVLEGFHERAQFYYWMLRVPIMFNDREVKAANDQHRRIVQALIDRDEDAADRAAREHVEATMRIIESAMPL